MPAKTKKHEAPGNLQRSLRSGNHMQCRNGRGTYVDDGTQDEYQNAEKEDLQDHEVEDAKDAERKPP